MLALDLVPKDFWRNTFKVFFILERLLKIEGNEEFLEQYNKLPEEVRNMFEAFKQAKKEAKEEFQAIKIRNSKEE